MVLLSHAILDDRETKMTAQKETKKINLLELSDSEKASFIDEIRRNLRRRLEDAKFWRSLAESNRIIINGLSVDF